MRTAANDNNPPFDVDEITRRALNATLSTRSGRCLFILSLCSSVLFSMRALLVIKLFFDPPPASKKNLIWEASKAVLLGVMATVTAYEFLVQFSTISQRDIDRIRRQRGPQPTGDVSRLNLSPQRQ